jgi:hypothetical protein
LEVLAFFWLQYLLNSKTTFTKGERRMGIRQSNLTLLSRDIAEAVKHHCFNNVTAFYKRHHHKLPFSKMTFYRILNGEYASVENVECLEKLCVDIGIGDKTGGSTYLVKARTYPILENLIDKLINPEIELAEIAKVIQEIKVFMRDHRKILKFK